FWGALCSDGGHEAPLAKGAVCLVLTMVLGASPLLALAFSRRDSDPTHPRWAGAALGAASGAWAGVLIHLICEYPNTFHVVVGHVVPIALLALVGAALGRRIIGLRRDS